ncbi:hypothetical protein CB1_001148005 [Camelus ferus]|nr:hypothetical protein CB1_001148005 [Camelus ferus]
MLMGHQPSDRQPEGLSEGAPTIQGPRAPREGFPTEGAPSQRMEGSGRGRKVRSGRWPAGATGQTFFLCLCFSFCFCAHGPSTSFCEFVSPPLEALWDRSLPKVLQLTLSAPTLPLDPRRLGNTCGPIPGGRDDRCSSLIPPPIMSEVTTFKYQTGFVCVLLFHLNCFDPCSHLACSSASQKGCIPCMPVCGPFLGSRSESEGLPPELSTLPALPATRLAPQHLFRPSGLWLAARQSTKIGSTQGCAQRGHLVTSLQAAHCPVAQE